MSTTPTASRRSLGKEASLIISGLTCMKYFFTIRPDLSNNDEVELNYGLFKNWALDIHFSDLETPPSSEPFGALQNY